MHVATVKSILCLEAFNLHSRIVGTVLSTSWKILHDKRPFLVVGIKSHNNVLYVLKRKVMSPRIKISIRLTAPTSSEVDIPSSF